MFEKKFELIEKAVENAKPKDPDENEEPKGDSDGGSDGDTTGGV